METNKPMNFARTEQICPSQKLNEEMAMVDILDNDLVRINEKKNAKRYENRKKSLGAGRVGHPMAPVYYDRGCERALYYEMRQYKSERPFPAKLYRIFTMGHQGEDLVAENLAAAGFVVATHDKDGNQFGFGLCIDPETGDPQYKGYGDGIIIDGPSELKAADGSIIPLKYPFLWENKMVNNSKYNKFKNEGVERSHPQYYGQVQSYMNFLDLYKNPALLTMVNRNTGEIYPEFIRFNKKHTQEIINRAARIIEAKNPLSLGRAAKSWEKIPCKWCDYKSHCEKDENERAQSAQNPTAQAPSWLGKG